MGHSFHFVYLFFFFLFFFPFSMSILLYQREDKLEGGAQGTSFPNYSLYCTDAELHRQPCSICFVPAHV